jgi:hypothetical protein
MKPTCGSRRAMLLDHLDPAVVCPSFETIDEAAAESDHRIKSLLRHGTHEARSLARDLKRCMNDGRCGRFICPLCWRDARREFTACALKLLAPHANLQMLHVVPEGAAFDKSVLRCFAPKRFCNSVRAAISRTRCLDGLIIGGIDLGFDATTGLFQPHIHAIIAGEATGLSEALRKAYRRSLHTCLSEPRRVYRPVVVQSVGPLLLDRVKAVTYTAKSHVLEVRSYTGEGGRPRRSRPFRLSEPLHADELLWRANFSGAEFRLHIGLPHEEANALRAACATSCR